MNKVVVHTLDGRVLKGNTLDFVPNKTSFHLVDAADERKVAQIPTRELKAVFFVRSFHGDRSYKAPKVIEDKTRAPGRKLRVTFRDGEVIHGTSYAYTPGRDGFFLVPADGQDNNERIYIFVHATREVEVIQLSAAAR
ncbi:MAG TPA: hypothetical protein VJS92_16500 [Candidatus Polarisedimenticolaceae bacterium]|nr:hypothetical protein [Candidatus Polarisedimenticolaceae bacterium]